MPCPLPIRAFLLALACATAHAQATPSQTTPSQTSTTPKPPAPHKPHPRVSRATLDPALILLDPAHGGSDNGATLGPDSLEKDATVAFATTLKTALAAAGFTVQLTHASAGDQPSPDQRAEAANRTRAVACLLLHASNSGNGVHLFTSSLTPAPVPFGFDEPSSVLAWDAAQSASLRQSQRLAGGLSDAFHNARIPLVLAAISVAPIDSMTCPAVVVELSPLDGDTAATPLYQQRVADTVVTALKNWRMTISAENDAAAPKAPDSKTPDAKPVKPTPKPPTPKPKVIPEETPDEVTPPKPEKPAAEKPAAPTSPPA